MQERNIFAKENVSFVFQNTVFGMYVIGVECSHLVFGAQLVLGIFLFGIWDDEGAPLLGVVVSGRKTYIHAGLPRKLLHLLHDCDVK